MTNFCRPWIHLAAPNGE